MNNQPHWSIQIPMPVTVCNKEGVILEMNTQSRLLFKNDGGENLIGKSLLDCHPEPSKTKLIQLLKSKKSNTYLSSENGVQKLIHEMPWYINGEYQGFVEILIDLPGNIICSMKT